MSPHNFFMDIKNKPNIEYNFSNQWMSTSLDKYSMKLIHLADSRTFSRLPNGIPGTMPQRENRVDSKQKMNCFPFGCATQYSQTIFVNTLITLGGEQVMHSSTTSSRGKLLPRCYSHPPSFARCCITNKFYPAFQSTWNNSKNFVLNELINLLWLIQRTVVMSYRSWHVSCMNRMVVFSFEFLDTELSSWYIMCYTSDYSNSLSVFFLFLFQFFWLNISFAWRHLFRHEDTND